MGGVTRAALGGGLVGGVTRAALGDSLVGGVTRAALGGGLVVGLCVVFFGDFSLIFLSTPLRLKIYWFGVNNNYINTGVPFSLNGDPDQIPNVICLNRSL